MSTFLKACNKLAPWNVRTFAHLRDKASSLACAPTNVHFWKYQFLYFSSNFNLIYLGRTRDGHFCNLRIFDNHQNRYFNYKFFKFQLNIDFLVWKILLRPIKWIDKIYLQKHSNEISSSLQPFVQFCNFSNFSIFLWYVEFSIEKRERSVSMPFSC